MKVVAVIKMETVAVTAGAKTIAPGWTFEIEKASRDREALLTEKIRASFFQDLEGIRAAPGSDVRNGLVITLAALWQAHDGFLSPDDAYAYLWAHRSVDWTDRALMATTLVALDRRLPHSFATFAAVDEEDLRELREENEWDCEMALFAAITPDNRVVHRLWFSDEVTAVAARMAL